MAEPYTALLEAHGVGGELGRRLAVYLDLLERWNRTHNLVRYGSREELVVRHVLESLEGVSHLGDPPGLLVDVGSGAGLPGVPLLAARPDWRGLLLEPRTKRWTFLRLVIRELGLDAEAVPSRYGEVDLGEGSVDVLTARALGGYGPLLQWVRPRLKERGKVLFWLGREEAETLESLDRWRVVLSPLPDLDRGVLADLQPCFT